MSRYSNEFNKGPYQGMPQGNNYVGAMAHSPNRLAPGYATSRGVNPINSGIFGSPNLPIQQNQNLLTTMSGFQAMGQMPTTKSVNLAASQNSNHSQYVVPPIGDKINILLKENEKLSQLLDEKVSENESLRKKLLEKNEQLNGNSASKDMLIPRDLELKINLLLEENKRLNEALEDKNNTENLLGDKYEEKLQLLLAETEKLEHFLKEQGNEVERWKEKYQQESHERESLLSRYKEKENEVNFLVEEVRAIKQEVESKQGQIAQLKDNTQTLLMSQELAKPNEDSRVKSTEEKLKKLISLNNRLNDMIDDRSEIIDTLAMKIDSLERKINILEIEKAQMTEKLDREREISDEWQQRYKESAKRIIDLTHFESDLEFARQRENHLQAQIQSLQEDRDKLTVNYQQKIMEIEKYQGQDQKIITLTKENDLLNQLISQEKANVDKLKARFDQKDSNAVELKNLKERLEGEAILRVDLENKVRILIEENEKMNDFLNEKLVENDKLKAKAASTTNLEHEIDKLNDILVAMQREFNEAKLKLAEKEEQVFYLGSREIEAERYKTMCGELDRRVNKILEENSKLNVIIEEKSSRINTLQQVEQDVNVLREQLAELNKIKDKYLVLERKMQVIFNENLKNIRVIQTHLVYMVGVPQELAKEEILSKTEYMGQYGAIKSIIINKKCGHNEERESGVYVTYNKPEEASLAILALDQFDISGRKIKAFYGSTKYCLSFIENTKCSNQMCPYLHRRTNDHFFHKDEKFFLNYKELAPKIILKNEKFIQGLKKCHQPVFPSGEAIVVQLRGKYYQTSSSQSSSKNSVHAKKPAQRKISEDSSWDTPKELPKLVSSCSYDCREERSSRESQKIENQIDEINSSFKNDENEVKNTSSELKINGIGSAESTKTQSFDSRDIQKNDSSEAESERELNVKFYNEIQAFIDKIVLESPADFVSVYTCEDMMNLINSQYRDELFSKYERWLLEINILKSFEQGRKEVFSPSKKKDDEAKAPKMNELASSKSFEKELFININFEMILKKEGISIEKVYLDVFKTPPDFPRKIHDFKCSSNENSNEKKETVETIRQEVSDYEIIKIDKKSSHKEPSPNIIKSKSAKPMHKDLHAVFTLSNSQEKEIFGKSHFKPTKLIKNSSSESKKYIEDCGNQERKCKKGQAAVANVSEFHPAQTKSYQNATVSTKKAQKENRNQINIFNVLGTKAENSSHEENSAQSSEEDTTRDRTSKAVSSMAENSEYHDSISEVPRVFHQENLGESGNILNSKEEVGKKLGPDSLVEQLVEDPKALKKMKKKQRKKLKSKEEETDNADKPTSVLCPEENAVEAEEIPELVKINKTEKEAPTKEGEEEVPIKKLKKKKKKKKKSKKTDQGPVADIQDENRSNNLNAEGSFTQKPLVEKENSVSSDDALPFDTACLKNKNYFLHNIRISTSNHGESISIFMEKNSKITARGVYATQIKKTKKSPLDEIIKDILPNK